MSAPLLTVVLPVHNASPYLEASLHSLLTQTYRGLKIVAIDDGSTDGSGEYLDSIRDPRLTVLHQSQCGLGAVLNRGIDLCDTPFLARMDADDIALPERFSLQMARLLAEPGLIAIGSPLSFLVHDTIQAGLPYPTRHERIVAALLRGEFALAHPTLCMRTEAARRTRYRITGAGEDLDFCLRMAAEGTVSNLETPQYLYRLHESSLSMTRQAELESGYAYARQTAIERSRGLPETSLTDFHRQWAQRSLWVRARSRLASASARRYRQARLAWARGQRLKAAGHLAISSSLQPVRSLQTVLRVRKPGSQA